jgi:signal transduction histidine kinase
MRRIWPRASFVAIVLAVAGYLAQGAPYGPVLLAPALSLHALASALPLNRWAPLTLLLVPMLMAAYWDQPWFGLLDPTLYGALVIGFAVMVVPAMVGLLRRNRRESERLERDQELRRYAYEERLQIAREVHDVVGHSLSVINLQAGVALHVLHRRPDDVEASLEAIKRTSREALAELRTTLAVFRDPTSGEPLAPRPGLDRLDDLVAALRAAGRDLIVTSEGDDPARPLPAAVDQAAYRIIQEALTNVVRHAGGAPARLAISRSLTSVTITVEDDGPGRPSGAAEGNGILGMRERAGAVGGTLSITQRQPSGFRVVADLPLNGDAE